DGFADMAVSGEGGVVLLHNEKNGTFKDVTTSAGIHNQGASAGVAFIDYDNDRAVDLIAPGVPFPVVFRNPREGKFELENYFRQAQEDAAARDRGGAAVA